MKTNNITRKRCIVFYQYAQNMSRFASYMHKQFAPKSPPYSAYIYTHVATMLCKLKILSFNSYYYSAYLQQWRICEKIEMFKASFSEFILYVSTSKLVLNAINCTKDSQMKYFLHKLIPARREDFFLHFLPVLIVTFSNVHVVTRCSNSFALSLLLSK